ncbi:MAG: hypothetical protein MK180_09360 [Rhodobacteraceae bacterium]|nr:hypothetical protein [Paracoccaceae bacterium]
MPSPRSSLAPALYVRLTTYVARVTTALRKGGRAGRALLQLFDLMKMISNMIVDLIRSPKARIAESVEGMTGHVNRIIRRVRRHDVPCFDLPKGADPKECDRQLAEQMDAINRMTAGEMAYAQHVLDQARAEKARRIQAGTWPEGASMTYLLRNNKAQKQARAAYRTQLRKQGYTPAQIKT